MSAYESASLGRLRGTGLSRAGYRNQASGFNARSGEGARRFGGRFNPANSFPVLYLCTTQQCVSAELSRQAQRQGIGVEDLLPRELWEVTAELSRVLDLTDEHVLGVLGVDSIDLLRDDHRFTQSLGESAHEQGFQAIRSRSATGVDDIVAVFPENLADAALYVELTGVWSSISDLPALN